MRRKGLVFLGLGYVIWKFVLKRQTGRIEELEQTVEDLRERLREARKDKWDEENQRLEEQIEQLTRALNQKNDDDQ